MTQMKAIRVDEFGEPEVLQHVEVEQPSPGEGEVLIEIKSAGVNYADTMRRRDQYVEPQELPFTPGSEVAGTVAGVGDGVEDVNDGERVVTLLGTGGYAAYAVAPARNLIPIPDGMDFDEAAAIPLQGLTAYHVLETSGQLKEGESVLVHAAAGGVGYLAVQMAKLMGASPVIATASTQEKLDLASELGADVLVNYTEENWPEQVREATDGNGADVILEMVGGDFPQKNLQCMNVFGRMIVFGAASGDRGNLVPAELMKNNHIAAGFYLPNIMARPQLFAPSLEKVLGWISSGDLQLTIGARYPLEQASEAHDALEGRETTGKIVLNP
ncbi:MAG: NADPH:quinone oxidoreductase [uncultured Rubrobacteraceae bacterium]|uniref:NADPH:quinone oxidoreductase n=1 Tax=uncultured Rubrobacteraceae bacterium TaxID=349277 RepID=A0A6J4QI06_9ACTN|nr:MAG: NADPH:quinone oxidoreductase [uncultured Rubrobacteraceae bacterium]